MALGSAVIVGVGPGLGRAIARTFANAGYPVAMLSRDKAKLDGYAAEIAPGREDVRGYAADAADPVCLRAALRPNREYASLTVGKAGLRAYVQVLHDQLAATGVHVTSVMITQALGSEPRYEPAVIARSYLELHNQPESEWQPELMRY